VRLTLSGLVGHGATPISPCRYCLLPPLQTCDKGNACLTCSVFVTDTSHLDTLQRQLDETIALIERTTEQFQQRHGRSMPDDNIWLAQRAAERDALVKLIATMGENPTRACQGAGSPTSGPVPITIDTTSHRKRVSVEYRSLRNVQAPVDHVRIALSASAAVRTGYSVAPGSGRGSTSWGCNGSPQCAHTTTPCVSWSQVV
jgi:hypothetical protein